MEGQVCSPEKYSMNNSHNKYYFTWMKKKIHIIIMFLAEYNFILTEWICVFISSIKGDIIKIYFIEYKFVLIEWKYILMSWKKGDIVTIYFIK